LNNPREGVRAVYNEQRDRVGDETTLNRGNARKRWRMTSNSLQTDDKAVPTSPATPSESFVPENES